MKKQCLTILLVFGIAGLFAQDEVFQTFKDRRVINSNSVETLKAGQLDIRITHRFGDIGGDAGGWETLFGLENAADVLIGAEYGITDDWTVGLFRTKGAGELTQLVSGLLKYRALKQSVDNSMPVTLTLLGITSASTAQKSDNENSLLFFEKTAHRFVYFGQALVARKFNDYFTLQLGPGYLHRNIAPFDDVNGIFVLSVATKIQLSRVYGLIADATFPFADVQTVDHQPAIGIGLEIDTGGHVFQINLTNSMGIMETDFIPYTNSSWGDSEFRLGFTISRLFNL